MSFRLGLVLRSLITVYMVLHYFYVMASSQNNWDEDDDDPGKFFLSVFFISFS